MKWVSAGLSIVIVASQSYSAQAQNEAVPSPAAPPQDVRVEDAPPGAVTASTGLLVAPEPLPVEAPMNRQGLKGTWILSLESAEVDGSKPNGKKWDASMGQLGGAVGGLVAAKTGVGILAIGTAQRLGSMVGGIWEGPELPDLGAYVTVDGRGMSTYVVRDTLGAVWTAEMKLELRGDEAGVVRWNVIDKDIRNDDYIGTGSFTLRELLEKGGASDFQGGAVTRIRFRLTRLSD